MRNLTSGNIGKNIVFFSLPIFLGMIVQQLYSVVDSMIVGKFIGDEALAAVGASFPIIFLLISIVVGISSGSTVLISQYYGAKNYEKINKVVDTMNIYLMIASIIISAIGIIFCEDIFRLMDLPEAIIPDATVYLSLYWIGLIGVFGFFGLTAVLRGLGDSKTPLIIQLITTIINIILNLLFIIVFKWGIAGSAIATVISHFLTFFGLAIYLNKRHELIKVRIKGIKFDWQIFSTSIKIGLPSGLQQSFVALGGMALIWIVSSFKETNFVTAYVAASRLDMLASVPAMAISTALTTYVGQNIGASQNERLLKGYKFSMFLSITFSSILGLLVFIFSEQIMMLFTNTPEIIEIGVEYLKITCLFYPTFAILFINNGFLRGAGDTIIPMFITLFALWVIRIPLSYLLSRYFGVIGIWWGIPAGWGFGMVFSYIYYKNGRWKKNKIIKSQIVEIPTELETAVVE